MAGPRPRPGAALPAKGVVVRPAGAGGARVGTGVKPRVSVRVMAMPGGFPVVARISVTPPGVCRFTLPRKFTDDGGAPGADAGAGGRAVAGAAPGSKAGVGARADGGAASGADAGVGMAIGGVAEPGRVSVAGAELPGTTGSGTAEGAPARGSGDPAEGAEGVPGASAAGTPATGAVGMGA